MNKYIYTLCLHYIMSGFICVGPMLYKPRWQAIGLSLHCIPVRTGVATWTSRRNNCDVGLRVRIRAHPPIAILAEQTLPVRVRRTLWRAPPAGPSRVHRSNPFVSLQYIYIYIYIYWNMYLIIYLLLFMYLFTYTHMYVYF